MAMMTIMIMMALVLTISDLIASLSRFPRSTCVDWESFLKLKVDLQPIVYKYSIFFLHSLLIDLRVVSVN